MEADSAERERERFKEGEIMMMLLSWICNRQHFLLWIPPKQAFVLSVVLEVNTADTDVHIPC